ncbi:hypothetical protein BJ742DRAFT_784609 [Cladochytrium replicatum]|nr:hypothetical protein BJ742DRAFT_784609 [Cladochytrium replicatum]
MLAELQSPLTVPKLKKSSMPTQQPTKKRHRATPSQLVVLESHFRYDPSPTPETREEISKRIQMNEKSIHIWFQNRRAKEKFLRRQGRQPSVPRDPNVPSPSGSAAPLRLNGASASPESSASPPSTTSALTPPSSLCTMPALAQIAITSTTLDIGTWHRILTPGRDSCFANMVDKTIEYLIAEGNSKFKLAYPMSNIAAMVLDTTGGSVAGRGSSYCAVLAFTLCKPPICYMAVPSTNRSDAVRWSETNDFTEARQSSTVLIHTITGPLVQLASDTRFFLEMEPSLKGRFLERSGPPMSTQPGLSTLPSLPHPQECQPSNRFPPGFAAPLIGTHGISSPEASPPISSAALPFTTLATTNSIFSTMPPHYMSYYSAPSHTAVTFPGGQLYIPPPPPTTIYPSGSGDYMRPPSIYPTGDPGSFTPPPSLYASSESALSFLTQSMDHDPGSHCNPAVVPVLGNLLMPYMTPSAANPMASYEIPKSDLLRVGNNHTIFSTNPGASNDSGVMQPPFNP